MRWGAALLAALALVIAPASAPSAWAKSFRAPDAIANIPDGAVILVMEPDIELNQLNATGIQEPKAEWSQSGTQNVRGELVAALKAKAHTVQSLDPSTAMEGREGQLLRLHDAVGASIINFHYGYIKLPTKTKDTFEWTLGDGAKELAAKYGADYAIFTTGRGSYSSGGRVATMFLMAALGVGVAPGGQAIFVSLVDLKTGKVVWFNEMIAGSRDMRDAVGAKTLVTDLLADAPL